MFLKKLIIENKNTTIREIKFQQGINLIIDETSSDDKKKW